MTRTYRQSKRAERVAQTRQRIVEATMDLHRTVGPARTTISDIAERAGVQRHTVYAHFRDERELFGACSAHWAALHPFPDPRRWTRLEDREARLRSALRDVYGWYDVVEHDIAVFERDAKVHAVTAEFVSMRKRRAASLQNDLAACWPRRKLVRAAIGHALEFETWRSLVREQGLTSKQAVDAMLRFVTVA